MHVQTNVSLRPFNTFGIDARAQYLVHIDTEAALLEALRQPQWQALPKLILGGGSNMLFTKDYEGAVFRIELKGISVVQESEKEVIVRAGAGEVWHEFVQHCLRNGWGGLENLSLIPGTVGACPIQNIGAYGVEIKEIFESLEAVHIATGEKRVFSHAQCAFGYRDSYFKQEGKGQYIITAVTFRLHKKHENLNVSYGAIRDVLAERGITNPSYLDVSEAVISIRQSKLPNPAELGNAGSFFKNPEIPLAQYEQLREQFPNVPSYPVNAQTVKVPAGWLIEQSGWKGKRVGNCGVHHLQALVIVNYGGATGAEIKALSEQIQADVFTKFGVTLSAEVNFIG
ncbi:UDP-N-acetylmuramate dehydrogenase [Flexibacter flexilis DSM 6793]|uniref:UDP-N-acetylenolpyruvoylglucosamine reductase n=1 Tax=Flexibacter flexilis DSM 6793 TaxID=927664 RepID=A0A1I1G5Y1_9BACT|nr:UDP-N-acetylmuramate dehydrogenase [Flexibacter flexilis]SFC05228.1 UDP-N-acetylmuramate dehydrogenase [Flexibacter flexilis DSM 6793]